MATNVTMKKTVGLGPTANIQFMAKEGQKIETGDPLMIFENDFDDANLSDLLSKIGDEFEQDIQDIASRSVKSKYSGVIKKVNIYYNRDLEDMTDTMRKIVESYIKKAKRKNNLVRDSFKENTNKDIPLDIDIPVVERIKSNKIKGEEVDGVLFEFFIEYNDKMNTGDKVSFYTALKTVVSDVFPEEEAPYSEHRPDEEIQALLSPLSVVSRMTVDVFLMMYTNKALIELKRTIADKLKE